MSNRVYYCTKCAEVQYTKNAPNENGCSKAQLHKWIDVGIKGNFKFLCKKCKAEVETTKIPARYGCKTSIYHEWQEREPEN